MTPIQAVPAPQKKNVRWSIFIFLSLLAGASTWFYTLQILKPHQIAYAKAHQQPRGNLSDLYPRWLGARELLLHGRNPYSREVTLEIQQGYYGRALDPSRADDPKDQQGFAYPAYVVFLLAPTINLPFEGVRTGFHWLLLALTALGVPLWLKVLRWRMTATGMLVAVVLVLGSYPVVQGIRLQQLSLLVAAMLAGCAACIASGYFIGAGVLLALSTIKPQLTWLLVVWLMFWAVRDWRARRRFGFAFGVTMSLLLFGAEILLPGWLGMFLGAIRQYHQYTHNQSVLEVLLGAIAGRFFDVVAILIGGIFLWQKRDAPASSPAFGRTFALVMALSALIVPMFAPYNQVFLIPAILWLVQSANTESLPSFRLAGMIGTFALVWPWLATIFLCILNFAASPERAQSLWQLPFYSAFFVPILVFALMCLDLWSASPDPLLGAARSE